jgi:hypothetical protein
MNISIRPWQLSDAADVATIINNKKIQDNLRDGIPYPYTMNDGKEFISSMLSAETSSTFAFAITLNGNLVGSKRGHISIFGQDSNPIARKLALMNLAIRSIEADRVEGIVAMPSNLFYGVTIPATLWFISRIQPPCTNVGCLRSPQPKILVFYCRSAAISY